MARRTAAGPRPPARRTVTDVNRGLSRPLSERQYLLTCAVTDDELEAVHAMMGAANVASHASLLRCALFWYAHHLGIPLLHDTFPVRRREREEPDAPDPEPGPPND